MKNRLNNKGFAVSTVVYAILILLVILMFTILLLYRNTYRNQKQFNADVQDELNDYLIEQTPPDTNPPACTLKSVKNADGSYTLTITSTSTDLDYVNGAYMFEGENYSNEINKVVKKSDCAGGTCTYKAYVRDTAVPSNVSVACETTVKFDVTPPSCTLSYNKPNVVVSSGDTDLADKPFSFNGSNFDSVNFNPVSVAGTYTVYVKDKSDNIGNCSITLYNYTATFYLTNSYSGRITFPESTITENCIAKSGSSCNITTPDLTVSSTSTYTYTAKGWSTSKNSSSATVSKEADVSISSNVSYYPVITRAYSGGSGGSSGGETSKICTPGADRNPPTDCRCNRNGTATIWHVYCNVNGNGWASDDTGAACNRNCEGYYD